MTAVTACVLGDSDLLAPLARAGVRCSVVAPPDALVRWSRYAAEVVDDDPASDADARVDLLLAHARRHPGRPVLYVQDDEDLLLASRHRARLGTGFRLLLADPELVEDCVDKVRFAQRAERLGLPVPRTRIVPAGGAVPDDVSGPVVVKPASRAGGTWDALAGGAKAVRAANTGELRSTWEALAACGSDLLVQELVPGPETRLESYHCLVDGEGRLVAEMTGRKVRTLPVEYGRTTALVTTDAADVAELGRDVVSALGLVGPAKVDVKRAPDGRLRLLEVNPRCTLWHHAGAAAGLNLPFHMHEMLHGRGPSGREVLRAEPGVRWIAPADVRAARRHGVPLLRWLGEAFTTPVTAVGGWRDPLPLAHHVGRAARRVVATTGRR